MSKFLNWEDFKPAFRDGVIAGIICGIVCIVAAGNADAQTVARIWLRRSDERARARSGRPTHESVAPCVRPGLGSLIMTVDELRVALANFPGHLPVMVPDDMSLSGFSPAAAPRMARGADFDFFGKPEVDTVIIEGV